MPSNKRIMEMSTDVFDVLPDELLIDILSFLGVKGAGITSVLSKRWECLWSELTRLEFVLDTDPLNYVCWVNRTIDVRKANYLEKFMVNFKYEESFASDVDGWVEFCVKNKVKQLILGLSFFYEYYTPPQVMYSCSSLTTLDLRGCSIMAYNGNIEWQSLTKLTLLNVVLDQHLLDKMLSSCPVLNNLELEICSGFNRLVINSRRLKSLVIEEEFPMTDEAFLEISAPYIRSLDIKVFANGTKSLKLVNISSVVTASIDLYYDDDDGSVEMMDKVNDFVESFKHVNHLHVRHEGFKILSNLAAVNGWKLPQFRLQHLKIDSCREYLFSISGITCLVQSSPNLKTLFLNGIKIEGGIFLDPNGRLLPVLASILRR